MQYLIEGFLLGMTLSVLLGPIFIALTETSIKHGIRAGISVGTGIWISDILVIVATYIFIQRIQYIVKSAEFNFWMGIIGGLILITTGIMSIIKTRIPEKNIQSFSARSYFGYFTKGFVVNFFNPFTLAFWLSVMTNYVIVKKINGLETFILFGTIIITIICTDTMKVVLSKLIKSKLETSHLNHIGKIAGVALVIFGFVLMVRTNVFG